MLQHLQQMIKNLNTENEPFISMKILNGDIIIGFCSALMKRVHALIKQSGELVFVDGSGGMDRHGCKIYLMMTHSCCGGLPLGVLITTSESEKVLTEGFQLLKELFPSDAFFGREDKGPQTFMTDDSDPERKALLNVFPQSTLLLCAFHILQAMWRFLWDSKHKIAKEDRSHFLKLAKSMLYAQTEDDLISNYAALCMDGRAIKYPCLMTYVERLYRRRAEWAVCFRHQLPVRGNNTNNFCEAAVRVLKDKIFFRTKAFNIAQLVDFLFTRLENVYAQKLLDVANNRQCQAIRSRYISVKDWALPKSSIKQLSVMEYCVPSQKNPEVSYHVDMEAGICSCTVGLNGGPCKHQHMVAKYFNVSNINIDPRLSPGLRRLLYRVATGSDGKAGWFDSLHCSSKEEVTLGLTQETTRSVECTSSAESEDLTPMTLSVIELPNDECINSSHVSVQDEINEIDNDVDEVASILRCAVKKNPNMLIKPLKEFLKNLKKMKTEASIVSALSTFGKYSGVAISRQNLNGKLIGVQPTAAARRKTAVGGRRSLGSGRPVKRLQGTNEENCSKLRIIKKRSKAPHKLSACVENSVALGKSHSSKS